MKTHFFDLTCNAGITLILNISYFKFSYLQTSRADAKWPFHCYTTSPGIPKCSTENPHPSTSWRYGSWYISSLGSICCSGEGIQRKQLNKHLRLSHIYGLLQQKLSKVSLWQSLSFAHTILKLDQIFLLLTVLTATSLIFNIQYKWSPLKYPFFLIQCQAFNQQWK